MIMRFDNHYPNRKDWRRPYYRSGRFDRSCRPGGRCPYCYANRMYRTRRELERAEWQMSAWERGELGDG